MVKDVKLKKGMWRDEVNRLLKENEVDLELVDEVYGGVLEVSNWKCKCGEEFKRVWNNIKNRKSTKCEKCSRGVKAKYNNLQEVILTKNMDVTQVNKLIAKWILLSDEEFKGSKYNHDWKCKCGNPIKNRRWTDIKGKNIYKCNDCNKKKTEHKYKYQVEKDGEYEYIKNFRAGEILPNGKQANRVYLQIKHKYCGNTYEVSVSHFINRRDGCPKCCQKYENSFAYYIEQELEEKLEKYWDSEKNTSNPYHISKCTKEKVWIKCTKTEYHNSYSSTCYNFINGNRCPYCTSKKIHPKDSFAQYCIDTVDKNFMNNYWSIKNRINPFFLSKNSSKKVWIVCQEKKYHKDYEVSCDNFIKGKRCGYCRPQSGKKIHFRDSFGYNNFDKVLSWHGDNNLSPFRVTLNSNKKYKFICPKCSAVFKRAIRYVNTRGCYCFKCLKSEGEKKIEEWLIKKNISYKEQVEFNKLVGVKGGNLSYDFYLPKYKLLIEYQGEFHDGTANMQTEEQYKRQQEHDRRKREYATTNGYELLEIWHQDFDNIEEILDRKIGK
ncbi:hypothetical protein KGF42_03840 [Clostridioides sp. ZZV15-6383]|uniref:zinc-ribbon domain-containing protein n=1 Tax=Clostridioides sp. ZZV15-6383 TaxID=2811498 RepID=UPI001D0FED6C|nr:hypothetical protein [Clostridioides sp. ZZV15-6383]